MSDWKKITKEWIRTAERSGWTIRYSGQSHICFVRPDGRKTVIGSISSDNRARMNARQQLRRFGLRDI